MTDFKALLRNPPEAARGMTRWWWYGCAVEEKEIDRELNLMKEAGIGGVELQILYPLHRDDREKGVQNVPYFSPRFFELTGYAAHRCRELGLRFDFTPGSSWPYGGPPITQEYAMQSALPYQIDIQGPCTYAHDFTTQFTGEVCAASLGKMENSRMLPETVRDVTGAFTDKYLFNWPWGTQMKAVEVPEGPHKLTIFVINRYRMMALKPCPNADGLVMDHCSAAAFDRFFGHMVEPLVQRLGDDLGSLFCDSIECDGHNWSGVLLEEFEKRRGYSLKPYIYALWGDMGEATGDIRYDYFRTMSELTIENFFQRFTAWSKERGHTTRIQAHGTWGDILKVYACADIPEGETFGEHDKLECNTIHRRLASSSGHIYGKQIISNESFTWLKVPRFTETLQDLKAAVDAIFLDGMNMIVNHGYAYSPELAGPRGWPFYASCNINHTAGWWPLYHHVARYIQSCSALLREGVPVSDIAVYLPQADVWAENLLSDIHLAMKLEERIGRETADRINKAGYWFDYLNDEAVCSLGSITPAGLCIETNCYRTILLLQCTRLPLEAAGRLVEFVRAGGTLIADGVPCRSCGLVEGKTDHERVRALMDELFGGGCGRGRAIRVENKEQALLQCLHAQVKPDVRVEKNDTVGFVHRRCGEQELYFFSNISREAVRTALTFYQVSGGFRVLCAESGRELPVQGAEKRGGRLSVTLQFKPMQSLYFVFSPELKPGEVWVQEADAPCACREVSGWLLTVDGKGYGETPAPQLWNTVPGLEWYSGLGTYSAAFHWTADEGVRRVELALENLHCTASVYINEVFCGDIWKLPYTADITPALREGENTVRLEVRSTVINAMLSPETKAMEQEEPALLEEWPYFGETINDHLRQRYFNWREREYFQTPQPSGLGGSVRLLLYQ